MRALIVSPYLDHLGGGERYMLSVASVLESLGYQITFSWDNLEEIDKLATMLGITLKSPSVDPRVMKLYHSSSPLGMYLATKRYDLTVYLSDGSLPLLGSSKSLIHMQVPFHNVGGNSLKNKIKKHFCHGIIVNSRFTKNIIDQEYDINSIVLYPPVQPIVVTGSKGKTILSVGRFEPSLNAKKQDVLITAFQIFAASHPDWRLVLAGGSSSEDWVNKLKAQASNLPITFEVNVSYERLQQLYSEATIYWHAAGYGVDVAKSPELTEHFGISCVEAISAGCAPFVIAKGGQPEIVTDSSYYWETPADLAKKTAAWISSPRKIPAFNLDYSLASFASHLATIIKSL